MRLSRITKTEIPIEERWDVHAAFRHEQARIFQFIEERAGKYLREAHATQGSALDAGEVVQEEIASVFATRKEDGDQTIIRAAATGVLEREAPSRWMLATYGLLRYSAMISIVGLFVLRWILDNAKPHVIIPGILLALSAFLLGIGCGKQFFFSTEDRREESRLNWLFIVLGAFGVVVIPLLRLRSETTEYVFFLLETLLALLVATFEALHIAALGRYNKAWDATYLAQLWTATDSHKGDLENGRWLKRYEFEVKRLTRTLGRTLAKDTRSKRDRELLQAAEARRSNIVISRVMVSNIGCFESLDLAFEKDGHMG